MWSYQRISWQILQQGIDTHLGIAYSNTQFALGVAAEQCLGLILEPAESGGGCDCTPALAGDYSFFTRIGDPVSESSWGGSLRPHTEAEKSYVRRCPSKESA